MPHAIRTLTRAAACAAAGAALAAVPAPASASTGLPRAIDQRAFMIDVKGIQTTNWTLNKPSA